MAAKNGDGIVYHCSDCGENYVRYYGFGGDGPGSACDKHGLSFQAIKYIHEHPEINHRWEDMVKFDADLTKKDVVDKVPGMFEDSWNQIKSWFGW